MDQGYLPGKSRVAVNDKEIAYGNEYEVWVRLKGLHLRESIGFRILLSLYSFSRLNEGHLEVLNLR
jgi:hypothetical protein